jgi:hypothetical protein
MFQRGVIIAVLAFCGLLGMVWWQGPDETTKSDVVDFQTGTMVKAPRNSEIIRQMPRSSPAPEQTEAEPDGSR